MIAPGPSIQSHTSLHGSTATLESFMKARKGMNHPWSQSTSSQLTNLTKPALMRRFIKTGLGFRSLAVLRSDTKASLSKTKMSGPSSATCEHFLTGVNT